MNERSSGTHPGTSLHMPHSFLWSRVGLSRASDDPPPFGSQATSLLERPLDVILSKILQANFREFPLPRTQVNKGKKRKGRGYS